MFNPEQFVFCYLVICYQQANLYILAAHQLGLHLEHTTSQGCLSANISH